MEKYNVQKCIINRNDTVVIAESYEDEDGELWYEYDNNTMSCEDVELIADMFTGVVCMHKLEANHIVSYIKTFGFPVDNMKQKIKSEFCDGLCLFVTCDEAVEYDDVCDEAETISYCDFCDLIKITPIRF